MKILLADDDRLIVTTLADGLRAAGYEVVAATDGEEAWRLARESLPDLALLDVRMPGLGGIELARRLRELDGTKVLFLSAYGDLPTVRAAVAEGALGYLVKPLDVTQIIPALEAAASRGQELRALRSNADRLERALETGREVSIAVGMLMERRNLDGQGAFETLRTYARSSRRKIVDVAEELIAAVETINAPKPPDR